MLEMDDNVSLVVWGVSPGIFFLIVAGDLKIQKFFFCRYSLGGR